MTLEQLQQLCKASLNSYGEGCFTEDSIPEDIDCEVVEDEDFTQDGKYQYACTILKFGDNYFQIQNTRSGSYHTDWYYGEPSITQVKPVTKTVVTTTWVDV